MDNDIHEDGGTLYSVAFITKQGKSLNRLVLIKQPLDTNEIKKIIMTKFQTIETVTHVDEWQPVLILEN